MNLENRNQVDHRIGLKHPASRSAAVRFKGDQVEELPKVLKFTIDWHQVGDVECNTLDGVEGFLTISPIEIMKSNSQGLVQKKDNYEVIDESVFSVSCF